MNCTENYFIELLRGFVTDSIPKLNNDNVDEQELLELARRHNVRAIVAYMTEKAKHKFSADTEKLLQKAYDNTVVQMINREAGALLLCRRLSSEKIPHILFKGITISETYPVKELRTFGDVDIIVRAEDDSRIRVLMSEQGYSRSIADGGIVTVYDRGKEHYEFHTALNVSRLEEQEFFADIWNNVTLRSGTTYAFEHNFHLSYLISHIEKHVKGGGAGIKMYLDIAMYIGKHREQIDLDRVREIMNGCKLGSFLSTVLYLCNRWFSLEVPQWVEPIEEEVYEKMCDFTLAGGIFGAEGETSNLKSALNVQIQSGRRGAKFRLLLGRVFPPFRELSRLYPAYEGKPLLAPVAWVSHIFCVLKNGKLTRIKEIATADVASAQEKADLLENIGSGK